MRRRAFTMRGYPSMISLVARGMLLSLGLVFAVAFAAGPAHAIVAFWETPVCMDPIDVSDNFEGDFGMGGPCASLCKTAAGMCRHAVKDAASCEKTELSAFFKMIAVGICGELEGVEKAECLAEIKGAKASEKDAITGQREIGLGNCDLFFEGCMDECTAMPK